MVTTKQLETKINELTELKTKLEKESSLDYIKSSGAEILQNLEDRSTARENVIHLTSVIAQLNQQLEQVAIDEANKKTARLAKSNFAGLKKQAEAVNTAISQLETELAKLNEMAMAIAPEHKQHTGRIPLENRLDRSYTLPSIEILDSFIILHNQPRRVITDY